LVVGESGTGKTTLLRTCPKPFVADFDNKGVEALMGVEGGKLMPYTGPDAIKEFNMELAKWKKEGPQYGCETFCVDSLTFYAEAVLADVLRRNNRKKPELQDWQEAITAVKDMVAGVVTLPCHAVITAHFALEKDELVGGMLWQVSIYGRQLPGQLPAYFNDVWITTIQMQNKQGVVTAEHKLQTHPSPSIKLAKSAKKEKLDMYEAPNFGHIVAKLSK
jgi:hypothetical protein